MSRLAAIALVLVACQREERDFGSAPSEGGERDEVLLTGLTAGGAPPIAYNSVKRREYEENATTSTRVAVLHLVRL